MYAVLLTGGKQYIAKQGDILKVEKLEGEKGDMIELDRVLCIKDAEENIHVGRPYIENARIQAKIVFQGKDKKIVIGKYKRRKKYRRKAGHRQHITHLLITDIKQ